MTLSHTQTAEYIAQCTTASVLSLEQLGTAVRAASRAVNAMLQQVGIWQRELRDAEFVETNADLKARMHNCDQRQRAMMATLAELSTLLQRTRVHIEDLSKDQAALARSATTP